jgi:hypothetical protein
LFVHPRIVVGKQSCKTALEKITTKNKFSFQQTREKGRKKEEEEQKKNHVAFPVAGIFCTNTLCYDISFSIVLLFLFGGWVVLWKSENV